MESQDILAIGIVPPVRHQARLIRTGTWVQRRYDDGTELTGLALVGRLDRWRFGVREVHRLEDDGRPYTYCGVVPAAERTLEVYLGSTAPPEIVDRVAAVVRHLDREGRQVRLVVDGEAERAVEHTVLWRWRFWRWVRRMVISKGASEGVLKEPAGRMT